MESNRSILAAEPFFRDFRPGSGGRRLAFARWELPDGREPIGRVCLCHGYGEHGERYGHTAAWLLGLGWAVSAQDHAGFGRSEGRRGDAEGIGPFVADWGAFLAQERALAPARPLVTLGHSFGGLVTLMAALRDPSAQDGLILSSPAVFLRDRGWPMKVIESILGRLAPHLALDLPGTKSRVCSDAELVRRYWADPLCHRRVSAAFAQALAEGSRALQEAGSALACPTLLLQAGADTLVDLPRAMAFWDSVNPAILETHLLEGFLHEVFHDQHRQVAQDLAAAWLARPLRSATPGTPADPAVIHA